MMTENTMENLKVGSPTIKAMFLELAKADANLRAAKTDIEQIDAAERHWAVRERIATTSVSSLADLTMIARALEIERNRDPDFENDASGSARALAIALANGVIQLATPAQ